MHGTQIDEVDRREPGRRAIPGRRKVAPAKLSRRKLTLLTRQELDGRTTACKQFDAIAASCANDLGGEDQLSTVQKHLVEAFAGIALHVADCNARLLLGDMVNILEHAQAVSTLVRVASRLGIERVPRNVTPSLSQYLTSLRERDSQGDEAAAE